MEEHPFAVVYFIDDGSHSEVPTSWLLSKSICWWPTMKNVSSLITRMVTPEVDNGLWNKHNVKVIGYYATVEAARKKATDTDCTSSEDERGRGLRRKKKTHKVMQQSEEEGETSDSSRETPPPIIKKSSNRHGISSCSSTTEGTRPTPVPEPNPLLIEVPHVKVIDTEINSLTADITLVADDELSKNVKDLTEKVDYLIKANKKILIYVKSIEDLLSKSKTVETTVKAGWEDILKMLPMDTTDDIVNLDSKIKEDKDLKETFINYSKSVGGRNSKEMISRVMAKLLTNSLGINCSLLGKRNRFCFKQVVFMDIIIRAVHQAFPSTSESEIELAVGEWLRLSKLRKSREK